MSSENTYSEDNIWSSFDKSAAELSIGSKLSSTNGIILEKVTDELWEYQANSTKISYHNGTIDAFKSINSVTFNVETN